MVGGWERQIGSAKSILSAILKRHGESLNNEFLRTVLVQIEGIINAMPIICENIGNVNSIFPLSPTQLPRMQRKIVMTAPAIFQREDMRCCKQ